MFPRKKQKKFQKPITTEEGLAALEKLFNFLSQLEEIKNNPSIETQSEQLKYLLPADADTYITLDEIRELLNQDKTKTIITIINEVYTELDKKEAALLKLPLTKTAEHSLYAKMSFTELNNFHLFLVSCIDELYKTDVEAHENKKFALRCLNLKFGLSEIACTKLLLLPPLCLEKTMEEDGHQNKSRRR